MMFDASHESKATRSPIPVTFPYVWCALFLSILHFFGSFFLPFRIEIFMACGIIAQSMDMQKKKTRKRERQYNGEENNFVRVMTKANIWFSMINSIHKQTFAHPSDAILIRKNTNCTESKCEFRS